MMTSQLVQRWLKLNKLTFATLTNVDTITNPIYSTLIKVETIDISLFQL